MLKSSVLLKVLFAFQLVVFGVNSSYFVTDRYVSVYTTPQTWQSALQICKSNRMTLVTVKSSEENRELTSIMKQNNMNDAWIGATDFGHEGKWTWADGSDVTQGFWLSGQPDNYQIGQHCCRMVSSQNTVNTWDDIGCDYKAKFMCETPKFETKNDCVVNNYHYHYYNLFDKDNETSTIETTDS